MQMETYKICQKQGMGKLKKKMVKIVKITGS